MENNIREKTKSLVHDYFAIENGKVTTTDILKEKLKEWEITYDEFKSAIEVAKCFGKKRSQIYDEIYLLELKKEIEEIMKSDENKELKTLVIFSLLILLLSEVNNYENKEKTTIKDEDYEL